jgi:glycosyltransferase involved in cell wall biosynthesis
VKIALDLTPLMRVETGVDRYLLNLVQALAVADQENEYLLLVNPGDQDRLPDLDRSRWSVVPVHARSRWRRLVFQQFGLPRRLRREGVEVLHSPSFLLPLRAPGLQQVLSVHDITFFTEPQVHNRVRRSCWFRWLVAHSIDRADHIVVPSGWVKDTLLRFRRSRDPATVHVVEHGLDPRFRDAVQQAAGTAPRAPGLPRDYILFVGTLEPRKNLLRLVEAYRSLLQGGFDWHLVLAGQWGWQMSELQRTLKYPELAGRVHVTGYLPHDELLRVYTGAGMLVYPSLAEGFGFPPLEAMALGVPVIVSNSSALGELYGDAALTVEPTDVPGMASAIRRLAADPAVREDCRRRGLELARRFTWEKAALRTLAVYRTAYRSGAGNIPRNP